MGVIEVIGIKRNKGIDFVTGFFLKKAPYDPYAPFSGPAFGPYDPL
jgi:hypothetical protein